MTQKITQLQARVTDILPLLDANLKAAYNEWMNGKISRGAYEYCLSRHGSAISMIGRNPIELNEDIVFKIGATFFIDLRSAIKDVPAVEMERAQKKIDDLLSFYVKSGFTETNKFLEIPALPETDRTQEWTNCISSTIH